MRKSLLSFFSLVIIISLVGAKWEPIWNYVSGGASSLWRDVVMNLQAFDIWLLDRGIFPSVLAIGILGFTFAFFWPQMWKYFRRYDQAKKVFEDQFNDITYQEERQIFSWNLIKAYKKYNKGKKSIKSIDQALRDLSFPKDFPPKNNQRIADYAKQAKFPKESEQTWEFFKCIFHDMLEPKKQKYLNEPDYRDLLDSRRTLSKFWDNYARLILQGKLRYEDIQRPIDANILAIKALAISELAAAYEFSWDPGPGKTPLFKLALGPENMKNGHR